jgi:hypothetical protein
MHWLASPVRPSLRHCIRRQTSVDTEDFCVNNSKRNGRANYTRTAILRNLRVLVFRFFVVTKLKATRKINFTSRPHDRN